MVCHDKKVERSGQLDRLTGIGGYFLSPREPVGIARSEPRAEGAGVHREPGVQMRVAEEGPRGEVAARIGRVIRLRGVDLFQVRLTG